jgi:hypothetical protein
MDSDLPLLSKKVTYWLELKAAWSQWLAEAPMPGLDREAELYFEGLALAAFNSGLEQGGYSDAEVPRMRSGREAWSHSFQYLVAGHTETGNRLLDDLFARVFESGGGTWADLDHKLRYLENQFRLRIRDAARQYAREYGQKSLRQRMSRGDKPIGNEDEASDKTIFDTLMTEEPDWGTEVEREELQQVIQAKIGSFFPPIRLPFKIGLCLRAIRTGREVIISVAEESVTELAGVKHSVLAAGIVSSMGNLLQQMRADPAGQQLEADDREGARYFYLQGMLSLQDRAEVWVLLAEGVGESLALNEEASEAKKVPAADLLDRWEAFAQLLETKLKEHQALASENELRPLFKAIEAARGKLCR